MMKMESEMEIEIVNINDLVPYENNPRQNDEAVAGVKESIKEFGFKVPMVIDQNNVIVCGHTRYKASKELGLTEIPCIRANDLTDEQIKAFRLADNKVGEVAEWDFDKLNIELGEIDEIDMSNFGFELADIEISPDEDINEDEDPDWDIDKLEKHYGVAYQGNKSRIADIIINLLPSGNRLVDLFGGVEQSRIVGCSQTNGSLFFTMTSILL